eukprot:CAMPEP_0183349126 /NCGR_PEP_ID=MMETSP0164_2-20130417/13412_1 /TAXON_ID=221442 /ORGANISM="Coccolithus pelagicus ssp braarudi, Strain PLY182g" /LENGTH=50 /DNA_ID=CAMNT_0025520805 /DNA_START=56 /DNA_END=205 /DNA_ORIENTATION=+
MTSTSPDARLTLTPALTVLAPPVLCGLRVAGCGLRVAAVVGRELWAASCG